MDEKELLEIKARSEEVKTLLGPYMQNGIEGDAQKLFAEVEKLRAEQGQLRSNIQFLKEKSSTLITEVEESLREIEASRIIMREVLEHIRGRFDFLNVGESLSKGSRLMPADLELASAYVEHQDNGLVQARAALEIDMIRQALARHKGNITQTAAELSVSRTTLYDQIQKHGIKIRRTKVQLRSTKHNPSRLLVTQTVNKQ